MTLPCSGICDRLRCRGIPPGARRGGARAFLIFLLLLPLAWSAPAAAQQQALGGTVLSASTRRPIADAQIQVLGTQRGVLSQTNGRFLLLNVPGDEVTLRVTLIGHKTLDRTVRVGDMSVQILLEETAVELDALVVTGTPGAQQVRALGNAVGKIDATALQEIAAPTGVRGLIGARIPGVNIVRGDGTVGSGGATAIRGVGSLSLSHEPLIYVDGVRVDNDPSESGTGAAYNGGTSRINDFNPEDIESIEVIKGPAATTLYGTEASNGVIQIITKRGRTQAAQWDFRMDQGVSYLPSPEKIYPEIWGRKDNELISMNIVAEEAAAGHPVFTTGHNQGYGAGVRGGTDDVQYYLSGDWNRNEGVVTYNWQNRLNLRSNLSFVLGDQLDLQFNLATMRFKTRSSGYQPITTMILWGTPLLKDARTRGMLLNAPEDYDQIHTFEDIDRTVTSVQFNHRPLPWLNQRLTVGGDFGFRRGSQLIDRTPVQPGPFSGASQGQKSVSEARNTFETVDYSATVALDLAADLRSETSVGGLFTRRLNESTSASGQIFPVPGLETVSATSTRSAGEGYSEERSVGAFVQEQFSYKNRYFLTAGVRGDDHSAFGKNFDFVVYPKVMGSWVASEEPFVQRLGFFNTLKLRAAWGQAGQQPSTFAAVRLYSPSTGANATPTVTPSNIGNPDLEPEKGEELEIGFDASFLDERLGLEFTYYDQSTKQALIAAPVQPSTGFPGTQSLNLGEISNTGMELGLNATPIRRENLNWNLAFTLATNDNEIVSLGGVKISPTSAGNEQVEGFPISGIYYRKVVSAELDANGKAINVLCDGGTGKAGKEPGGTPVPCSQAPTVFFGGPLPKWQGSLSSTLTLFGDLRLYALIDYKGGNHRTNGDVGASHVFFTNSRCVSERPICDPILAGYAGMGQYLPVGTMKAGFAKLRTLSASYELPEAFVARLGASRATLTLAGENLLRLWTAETEVYGHGITDPEIGKQGTALDTYEQEAWPQFTTITTSLRISF